MATTHAPPPAPPLSAALRSHSLTRPSWPEVIQASAPPGPEVRAFMQSLCASMICRSSPVATSQVRSLPSRPPVAQRLRSVEAKEAQVTASPCPRNLRSTFFASISTKAQLPPASPAKSSLPSLRQATHCVTSLNFERLASTSASPSLVPRQTLTFVPLTTASRCGADGLKASLTIRLASCCDHFVLNRRKCSACGLSCAIVRGCGNGSRYS
mmetsp:Transcript_125719/g.350238  ORF Transcript_125719/g.350238 Transcript_125719/m.350238 type:complete len:212 (+) Transcript_125719:974-1609(+)